MKKYSGYHKNEVDEEDISKEKDGSEEMVDILNFVVVKISNSSPKEGKDRMNEGSKVSNLKTNYKVVITIMYVTTIYNIRVYMSVFICKPLIILNEVL